MLSDIPRDNKLFFLAGGISADNVKEAIKKLSPDGIDVSTGVEYNASNKTGKDPQKIEEFVRIIRTEQKTYNRFSFISNQKISKECFTVHFLYGKVKTVI